jgi:hypothetical protein
MVENFLPKIDGVTRTLARLLDHLRETGHEALVVGPDNGLVRPPSLSAPISRLPHDLFHLAPPWLDSLYTTIWPALTSDILRRLHSPRNPRPAPLLLPGTKMEFPLPFNALQNPILRPRCPPLRRPYPPRPTSHPRRQTLPTPYPPRLKLPYQHRPLCKTLWLSLPIPRNLVPSTISPRAMFRDNVS